MNAESVDSVKSFQSPTREKRISITSSRPVKSNCSNAYSYKRNHMEHLTAEFFDQFQKLRHCIADMAVDTTNEVGSLVRQKDRTGPSAELSDLPRHQDQLIFELQNFAIQLQQHQQKLLKEVAEQQINAQIEQSIVQETENMRLPSEIDESKICSISPPLFVPIEEVYSPDRLEFMQDGSPQCNEKCTMIMESNGNITVDSKHVRQLRNECRPPIQPNRVDRTEGSLQEKENQVRSSILTKKGNLVDEKDSVILRKIYPCTECGKEFTRKTSLTTHRRIHTGEKPFQCHICKTAFAQKSSLDYHSLMHTGERPFVCNICQGSFRRKNDLTQHMHTHTHTHSGQKSYKCNVCQKSFKNRSSIYRHRNVCHTKNEE